MLTLNHATLAPFGALAPFGVLAPFGNGVKTFMKRLIMTPVKYLIIIPFVWVCAPYIADRIISHDENPDQSIDIRENLIDGIRSSLWNMKID
jgi:hypothetical protein